jgi:hypothetical protein
MNKPFGINELSPEAVVAIGKLIDDKRLKAARKLVAPGDHEVSLFLAGTMRIEVGDDSERRGTSRIPYTRVIALFLQRAGVTGQASIDLLTDVLQEANAMGKDAAASLEEAVFLGKGLSELNALVAKAVPPIEVKGRVKLSSQGMAMAERELTREEAALLFPSEPDPDSGNEAAEQ